jgi:hypothetical protein
MKLLPAHKTGAALLLAAALLCASCGEALQTYQGLLDGFTFTPAGDLKAGAAGRAGSFSAEGGTEPLVYKLVPGGGDTDNGLFTLAGNDLFIAAEALEEGAYRFRARVEDGEGNLLEDAFTLTVGKADDPDDPGGPEDPEDPDDPDDPDDPGGPDGPGGPDDPGDPDDPENPGDPGDSVPVSGVRLDRTQLNMPLGGRAVLVAEISPGNATNRGLSWSSSNAAVATVAGGTVTARSAGTARITVATLDGNKTASCAVRVWNSFQSLAAMSAGLGALPANSPAAPYYVMLSGVSLSMRTGGEGLKPLFPALAGRYVSLNLDACSGATIGWDETPGGHGTWPEKDKLVEVILPASTTHIGYYSFENCTALKSVVIPASVRAIGMHAFRGCTALESVTVLAETPPEKGNASLGWFPATGFTIYVPAASVAAYKAAEGWSYYAANIRALE